MEFAPSLLSLPIVHVPCTLITMVQWAGAQGLGGVRRFGGGKGGGLITAIPELLNLQADR